MRFVFFFTFFLSTLLYATSLKHIEREKARMIAALELDKEEKETLSQIIQAKFNLRAYKENYFLPFSYRYDSKYVDNDAHGHISKEAETEFQVSLQYDFAFNLFGVGEIYGFAYTQRSWWQLYANSAFFRETNYQPELFVIFPAYRILKKSYFKGIKVAFIHQSNGRGGEWERSWNRISLYGYFLVKNLLIELQGWYRLADTTDYNPDLLDYLGYAKLKFILPYKKHLFKLHIGGNVRTKKSAVTFTYSYPLPIREKENDLFFFVKTFNGYGESLVDYNHKVNKISIGLALSR